MTSSATNPKPVTSLPGRFLEQLGDVLAGVPGYVRRALERLRRRAETIVRRAPTPAIDAVPESLPAPPGAAPGAGAAVTAARAVPDGRAWRAARLLSAGTATLMGVGSAAGLVWKGLYQDPASLVAMLRGHDVVSLAVATPLLAGAVVAEGRGSSRATLVRAGMLAYTVYTYASVVFGTAFNALFLLHVAVLLLAVAALALTLADLDASQLAEEFRERTPVRVISGVLAALALSLGGMWTYYSLRFAVTGAAPGESRLVLPASAIHLGYVLDLVLLVPAFALASVLLWRRAPWGYVLAAVLLVSNGVIQLDYMAALVLQKAAGLPGAVAFDPVEPAIAATIMAAAAALLGNVRSTRAAASAR